MSTPDYLRLHAATLQLAASFEHAFPGGARQRVVWPLLIDEGWRDAIDDDPVIGTPTNSWEAFLGELRPRHEIFELIVEQVVELGGIIDALWRCRAELRALMGATNPAPRELLTYEDLFQRLLRSWWTIEDGKLCLEPYGRDGYEYVCPIEVRPPNVALVREMARLVGGDSQSTPSASAGVVVPTAVQKAILTALAGCALRTKALVKATRVEHSQMFRHMKELKERGLVSTHAKLGFFRPDHPPAILAEKLEGRRATK